VGLANLGIDHFPLPITVDEIAPEWLTLALRTRYGRRRASSPITTRSGCRESPHRSFRRLNRSLYDG
jgi:hypothetical protein